MHHIKHITAERGHILHIKANRDVNVQISIKRLKTIDRLIMSTTHISIYTDLLLEYEHYVRTSISLGPTLDFQMALQKFIDYDSDSLWSIISGWFWNPNENES